MTKVGSGFPVLASVDGVLPTTEPFQINSHLNLPIDCLHVKCLRFKHFKSYWDGIASLIRFAIRHSLGLKRRLKIDIRIFDIRVYIALIIFGTTIMMIGGRRRKLNPFSTSHRPLPRRQA